MLSYMLNSMFSAKSWSSFSRSDPGGAGAHRRLNAPVVPNKWRQHAGVPTHFCPW